MPHEITLPFKSETCEKIKEIFFHIFLFSGFPSVIIGFYYAFICRQNIFGLVGFFIGIYGFFMITIFFMIFGEHVSDWYDDNKIVFKCQCDKEIKADEN